MTNSIEHQMHAISPYMFRCYNNNIEGKREQRYSALDKIGSHDFLLILKSFVTLNSSEYIINEKSKQVYQFSDIVFDSKKRELYCWFNVGSYGMKADIIDIVTGNVSYEKTIKNSEIIKHFMYFNIPKGVNEGIGFLHSYRGNGVKTLFFSLLLNYFRSITGLNLQMSPLAYEKAIRAWLDAPAKEVRVTRFLGLQDKADQLKKLGHYEQELVIKPKRKYSLGKLRDYITQGNERLEVVELLSELGTQVKTVVELNGKKRTFCVGVASTRTVCEIELDNDVILNDGVPDFTSMHCWVKGISLEYMNNMYRGITMDGAA